MTPQPIPRVALVTTGLFRGGAEAMLFKLLEAMTEQRRTALVVSLGERAPYAADIEALGVRVVSLGFQPPHTTLGPVLRLRREVSEFQAEVLQGWMYHGNIAAVLGRPFALAQTSLVWSIRQTVADLANEKPMTARVIRLGARLSRVPFRIIYNSRTSARQHEALGYEPARTVVIPNGFDTSRFRPDEAGRKALRAILGVGDGTVVVGLVARAHPMKDHVGFLRAASMLVKEGLDVMFVLAGRDVGEDHPVIGPALTALELAGSPRIRLMPELSPGEIITLTSAFDIACSASAWGDAFPNVLGEAMSTGLPCVTTDVGDAAWIVGESGLVVPPREPEALAAAIRSLVTSGVDARKTLGARARARVVKEFDINSVAKSYGALWSEAAATTRADRRP